MIPLVTAQLAETLLGPPSRSLLAPGDPPLLGPGRASRVVLAAEEAAFVQTVGQGAREQDVRKVLDRINQELNRTLRPRRLESRTSANPPDCPEAERAQTLLGTLTPFLQETGGPQTDPTKKSQALLMVRLTLVRASDRQSVAVREFFSGYTLVRPSAGR